MDTIPSGGAEEYHSSSLTMGGGSGAVLGIVFDPGVSGRAFGGGGGVALSRLFLAIGGCNQQLGSPKFMATINMLLGAPITTGSTTTVTNRLGYSTLIYASLFCVGFSLLDDSKVWGFGGT